MLYYTEVEDSLDYDKGLFESEVRSIIHDKRGWTKLGYKFEYKKRSDALLIKLTSKDTIKKTFDSSLSYYDPSEHLICINYDNWMNGGKSTLSIDLYRHYVINHEVGHALGYDHPKCHCAGKKGSVMMQMTKGPSFISPCLENAFPLDNENEIRGIKGGTEGSITNEATNATSGTCILWVILFFLIMSILIVLLIAYIVEVSITRYY